MDDKQSIADLFLEMMAKGREVRDQNEIKKFYEAAREKSRIAYQAISDADLKRMWDEVDCDKCEGLKCCEMLHFELYRRGLGSHCPV